MAWKSWSKAAVSPHFAAATNFCSLCNRAMRTGSDLFPVKVSERMVKTPMQCSVARIRWLSESLITRGAMDASWRG